MCLTAGDKHIFYNAIKDTYTYDEIFKDKTVVNTNNFRIVVDLEESGRDVRSSVNTQTLMPDFSPLGLLTFAGLPCVLQDVQHP